MSGYYLNLEKETLENQNYRKVLYTSHYTQLVLMSLKPGEEIGQETHGLDQFIRVEAGQGKALIGGQEYDLSDGMAIIIPAGQRHNVWNTSEQSSLQLYSLYSPPEHKDGTIHPTKAEEKEEHFDGQISQ